MSISAVDPTTSGNVGGGTGDPNVPAWNAAVADASASQSSTVASTSNLSVGAVLTALSVPVLSLIQDADSQDDDPDDET